MEPFGEFKSMFPAAETPAKVMQSSSVVLWNNSVCLCVNPKIYFHVNVLQRS